MITLSVTRIEVIKRTPLANDDVVVTGKRTNPTTD